MNEQNSIVRFLVDEQRVPLAILRKMATRHMQIFARGSGEKRKSVEALHTEFLAHQCAEACLVLKSEAMLAGLSPKILSPTELQQCELSLGLWSNPQKRKLIAMDGNVYKRPRSSVETSGTPFPVILSQDEKDEIVHEFRAETNNASLKWPFRFSTQWVTRRNPNRSNLNNLTT
jgi:hypothetical protein